MLFLAVLFLLGAIFPAHGYSDSSAARLNQQNDLLAHRRHSRVGPWTNTTASPAAEFSFVTLGGTDAVVKADAGETLTADHDTTSTKSGDTTDEDSSSTKSGTGSGTITAIDEAYEPHDVVIPQV